MSPAFPPRRLQTNDSSRFMNIAKIDENPAAATLLLTASESRYPQMLLADRVGSEEEASHLENRLLRSTRYSHRDTTDNADECHNLQQLLRCGLNLSHHESGLRGESNIRGWEI
ncbi:uncharacterized protein LDX57_005421 [Aspergillus melleus]|uniref:uncharacterized protein n=1 Tax=Aspergillus melleus TaxID=138277 RepID=UPI001E8D30ED|nr:uncharacterized protein LDX57_005421 [Aspergillus melleus]KAH8427711.1 hypothetical protein LDX57_005421 [Aspergillus melleus]